MSKELQDYKDAVWQFLIEHSDITDGGSLFVKFHTSGRKNFENRVKAREVYGYQRQDTRLNMSPKEKEELYLTLSYLKLTGKKVKREKWKATREERQEVMAQVKAQNDRNRILLKFPKSTRPFINSLLTLYATARTTMIQYRQVGARRRGSSSVNQTERGRETTASLDGSRGYYLISQREKGMTRVTHNHSTHGSSPCSATWLKQKQKHRPKQNNTLVLIRDVLKCAKQEQD